MISLKRISSISFLVFLSCSVQALDSDANPKKERSKIILISDGKVEFYGKVVDQDGKPVPNALVEYSTLSYERAYDNVKRFKTSTDKEGNIKVEGIRAGLFGVDYIECIGYEPKKFNESFRFSEIEKERMHIPDPKNPVVFTVRKKDAEPVFIYKEGMLCKIKNISETYFSDIIYDQYWYSASQSELHARCHPDIKYTTVDNKAKEAYEVTLSVEDKDSGILEKDEKLFTAPADGYSKELVISIPYELKAPMKMTFYVKGRGGRFYSRIEAEIKYFGKMEKRTIDIDIRTYTNPYASRNLEDAEYKGDEREKLHQKVLVDYGYER